jgi:hypothetical protein
MSEPILPPRRGLSKVITCIMPDGRGSELLEALRLELGVISASVHHARGVGTGSLRHRVYAEEKQVLITLVAAEHADAVFEFLYMRAEIGKPHAGMVLMERAFRGAFAMPLPAGEQKPAT